MKHALVFLGLLGLLASTPALNAQSGDAPVADNNYILQPLDVITVDIFQEPNMSRTVRVSAEGEITLPLIGKVEVANMTLANVRERLTELYDRDYLVDPQLTLQVVEYTSRQLQIHGSVNRPGPVEIPPEKKLTLSEAISMAGGISVAGRDSGITIKRIDEDGISRVYEIDLGEILRNPDARDVYVRDGDVVYVPERVF